MSKTDIAEARKLVEIHGVRELRVRDDRGRPVLALRINGGQEKWLAALTPEQAAFIEGARYGYEQFWEDVQRKIAERKRNE